jgi:hypothetical protein
MYVKSNSENSALNDKYVFAADGTVIGIILIIFKESFFVRSIK